MKYLRSCRGSFVNSLNPDVQKILEYNDYDYLIIKFTFMFFCINIPVTETLHFSQPDYENKSVRKLSSNDLMRFSIEISDAMAFISDKNVTVFKNSCKMSCNNKTY